MSDYSNAVLTRRLHLNFERNAANSMSLAGIFRNQNSYGLGHKCPSYFIGLIYFRPQTIGLSSLLL